jgi:hypothetical protein
MFYIHILNRPPHKRASSKIFELDEELKPKLLVQYGQTEVKRIRQKATEDYYLQRRLFI